MLNSDFNLSVLKAAVMDIDRNVSLVSDDLYLTLLFQISGVILECLEIDVKLERLCWQ